MQKLDTLSFAVAGAIYGAAIVALATIAALVSITGFRPFADLLTQFYGFYGYSVSAFGVAVGAFWGFVEGFCPFRHFCVALQYAARTATSLTLTAGSRQSAF